jgi:hypothetical protein
MKKKSRKRPSMGRFLGDIQQEVNECIGSKPECIVKVLDSAADAAILTAQHVRENWQDNHMARAWERISVIIGQASRKVERELPF